ncbi:uncharacterized protein LOC125662195 [Ostrea edulis]|uniref:uncharacterized protein LOC125662195 n=1 Tax=Ostrea edulis TaxID=37623 RepID=UPI0024AECBC7|nr:uncharacterized protein LOC125662195 [Ostrea edulis]
MGDKHDVQYHAVGSKAKHIPRKFMSRRMDTLFHQRVERHDRSQHSTDSDLIHSVLHQNRFHPGESHIVQKIANRIVSSKRLISSEIDGRPFLRTNAYKALVTHLEGSNIAVVTGLPGNGKRFLACQCARTFQEEKQMKPFIVQHHQDWQVNIFSDKKFFIIVQDFCEVDVFSADFRQNLMNHIAGISINIHDTCTPHANKLLIILRKEVLHFIRQLFPDDIRFSEKFLIDVSSPQMRLTSDEKQDMMRINQVKLREDGAALMESDFPFGFPNACHFCQTMSEFSNHIDSILSQRLESMEPEFFLALTVVCLRGGRIKIKELYENETYAILHRTFKQTAKGFTRTVSMNLPFIVDLLTDVFFTKITEIDTTYVEYLHRSVNENVASIILRNNAGSAFQLVPLDRLQYFRSKLLRENPKMSTNTIFDWIIVRITREMSFNATVSVIQCITNLPEWNDEEFINMISAKEKFEEACRNLKPYQQECFLVCAIRSKSLNIIRLLFSSLRKHLFLRLCQENEIMLKVVETGSVEMFQLLKDLGVTLEHNKSPPIATLFTAARNNHLPMLSFLTEYVQIDPSFRDAQGCSLLHCAAKSGSVDVMEYLIRQGLDPKDCSVDNETILHFMAMFGSFSAFKWLCERYPGQIGIKTTSGKSVLHYAASNEDTYILIFLVENMKMNPHDKTNDGETLLHIACRNGNNGAVKHMLERYAEIIHVQDKHGMTAAHTACISGNLEAMKLLSQFHDRFKILTKKGESVLHCASMSRSLEVLQFVMRLKLHSKDVVTTKGYSLLHSCTSSANGDLDIVQYLIVQGFDVRQRNEQGQIPMHLACISGNLEIVRFLVSKYPELLNAKDKKGYDAILSCAKGQSLETLKYLENMQCFTHQTLPKGKGILHIACKHSSVDVVKYLCQMYPQELERRDSKGKTALHMSALNASVGVIQYLLDIEVDHYALSTSKQTILHLACYNSNIDILKYIAKKLPGLKCQKDYRGYTALHCSCEARNERAIKVLLNLNDFDVRQRTLENFTPLDIVFVNSPYQYEESTTHAIKTIIEVYKEQGYSGSLPEMMFRDIAQYQANYLESLHAFDYLDLAVYPKRLRGISESKMLAFSLALADCLNNEKLLNKGEKTVNTASCRLLNFVKYEKHHTCSFSETLIETGLTWSMAWCIEIAFLYPKEIREVCLRSSLNILRSGAATDVVKTFARGISKTFYMKYSDVLSIHYVWAGFLPMSHERYNNCIETIVVITRKTNEAIQRSLKEYHGLKIYFRDFRYFSPEAKEMLHLESDVSCDLKLRKEDIQRLIKNHSNISLVSKSSLKSIGYGTANQNPPKHLKSVVIYCRVKGIIPAGEKLFPTQIGGYPVDVRESAVTLAVGQEGLKMGDMIGLTGGDKTGTVGGFIDIDADRKGFITCAHVLTSLDNQTDNLRHQESPVSIIDRGRKYAIGHVVKSFLDLDGTDVDVTIDAALVEVQTRLPDSGYFTSNLKLSNIQQADFRNHDELSFTDGETATIEECRSGMVLKVGAASGLTRGHVHFENAEAVIEKSSVVLYEKRYTLRGQIEVKPYGCTDFISDGDSGSFVFLIVNGNPPVLKCVGLAVARTDHGTCLMTPIENVLSRFNLTIDQLTKFENNSEEEDILSKMFRKMTEDMNNQFVATNENVSEIEVRVNENVSEIRNSVARMENRLHEVENIVFNNPEDGGQKCILL